MRKVKNYVVHALLIVLGLVLVVACGTTRTTNVEVTPTEVTTPVTKPAGQSTLLPQVSSVSLALVAGYLDTGPHPGTYNYSLLSNSDPSVATAALDDTANTFTIDFLAEGTTTLEVEEKFNGVAIGTSKLQITIDANGAVKIALLTNFSGNASLSYSLGTVTHPTPQAVNPTLVGNELSLGFTGESGTTQIELVENNGATPTGLVGTLTIGTVANPGLVVSKDGTGTGSVSTSPAGIACGSDCSENYARDTEVTLTATADAGSVFTGWIGCDSEPSANTCVVTMSTIKAVTATFDPFTYDLNVSKAGTGTGTVSSAPAGIECGSDCTEGYVPDTSVTLTATADSDSAFVAWTGCDSTPTATTCVVAMSDAKSVTAEFDKVPNQLSVSKTGVGTGTVTSDPTGISCGIDCLEDYVADTLVTLTATADTGSGLKEWIGCDSLPTATTCVVTMSEAKSVTANFEIILFDLTVSKAGAGTGTVNSTPAGIACGADCTETYDVGTTVTLTATADADMVLAGWSGCPSSPAANECVVEMTEDRAVSAIFEAFKWQSISANEYHTCGLANDNQAYCWGSGENGEMGRGTTLANNSLAAVLNPTGVSGWKSVHVGGESSCGIADNDELYCWGADNYGQVGNSDSGGNPDITTPSLVNDPPGVGAGFTWENISLGRGSFGRTNSCGIGNNDQAYCWGVVTGTSPGGVVIHSPQPVINPAGVSGWKSISYEQSHACGIAITGKAYCWGWGQDGQLGMGMVTDGGSFSTNAPTNAVVNPSGVSAGFTWKSIDTGASFTCGIGSNNQAYCWGRNGSGQLGNGSSSFPNFFGSNTPVAVVDPIGIGSGFSWKSLNVGNDHSCGVGSNNKTYCWGINNSGALGVGGFLTIVNRNTPTEVINPVSVTGWNSVSAGWFHSCGISSDEDAYCWGYALDGQLGGSGTANSYVPVAVINP